MTVIIPPWSELTPWFTAVAPEGEIGTVGEFDNNAIPIPSFPTTNWWSFITVTLFRVVLVLLSAYIAIDLLEVGFKLIAPWFSISIVFAFVFSISVPYICFILVSVPKAAIPTFESFEPVTFIVP